MIAFRDVAKSFDGGRSFAVHTLSLEVSDGETLVLLGSSGSGKTTLLKMVNGLVQPTSGTVSIDGQDISAVDPTALRRSVGYVFQGIGLNAEVDEGKRSPESVASEFLRQQGLVR